LYNKTHMIDERFVIVGAVIGFLGTLTYIRDTLQGKTKPNRVSWFLWAVAPLIAFVAQQQNGVGLSSLMTFMVGFSPFLVFLASFFNKKSTYKLTTLDIWCGALSIIGLVCWQLSGSGIFAIIFSIAADLLAAIPTVVQAYYKPNNESSTVFLTGMISSGITLLTLKTLSPLFSAFPLYIFLICFVLYVLIEFKLGIKIQKKYSTQS
jgi:hypothetical protein